MLLGDCSSAISSYSSRSSVASVSLATGNSELQWHTVPMPTKVVLPVVAFSLDPEE